MSTPLHWERRSPHSANNFDLILANPHELDSDQMNAHLQRILQQTHRGLNLSSRAIQAFRTWFDQPSTPLKSDAYVLLSNWFMTQSGDRHSMVAIQCETLWDKLFPCRPPDRLSSPEAGRNHVVIPSAFENFWHRVLQAQGKGIPDEGEKPPSLEGANNFSKSDLVPTSENSSRENFERSLTIAEAKAALAQTFGVSVDKVEITIRG